MVSNLTATKPCHTDYWHPNEKRTHQEWSELSDWVATGHITEVKHDIRPYPNCSRKVGCSTNDWATFLFVVKDWEKEGSVKQKEFILRVEMCNKPFPKNDKGLFRFYGKAFHHNQSGKNYFSYINYEKLE